MRIQRVELYDLTLPLVEPFIISGGTMNLRRSLVVVLHDGEGHRGFGEAPPFELPFYSEEVLAGARHLLEHVLIPRILGRELEGFEEVDRLIRIGVRGNPFARSALDTAAWDLEAARRGIGIRRTTRRTHGHARRLPSFPAVWRSAFRRIARSEP